MHQQNIADMYTAVETDGGFDVVIVVSSSANQTEFWQERLQDTLGKVMSRKARVISVEEDWPGGAGQLLGTLYAWEKAHQQVNLTDIIQSGGTVAMYHTAGKGTRMAPLPAAEANNKSAIKLPRLIEINGEQSAITMLEAVIFQTGIFAASRGGRLCVFWGDQVFIPSKPIAFGEHCHAEILSVRAQIPNDEDEWRDKWQSYGLIIPDPKTEGALQREKQCWSDLQDLINNGPIKPDKNGRIILGKSLGCFSISYELLFTLLNEFSREISGKSAKMDTDPHLWMPLTSTREEFIACGGDAILWDRLEEFKKRFLEQHRQAKVLFGDKDVGAETIWWDYGQVQLYHGNFLKALDESFEGQCLRQFFDLEAYWIRSYNSDALSIENSMLLDSTVKGAIKNSVLVGVSADELDVSDSVIMRSSLSRLRATRALMYNCIDLADVTLSSGEIMADVFLPSSEQAGRTRMRTDLSRDGKEDWDHVIKGNPCSFAALSELMSAQSKEGLIAEKAKWMGYYANRQKMQQEFVHRFIKPSPDNLVEVVWGGTLIEKQKGLPASRRSIGESWECSTHPNHPSKVALEDGSDLYLDEALGHSLPILFKFLDAREDLSVQVHPSDEKAAQLGESDTGKTEAWLILDAEPGAVLYLGFKDDVDPAEFEKDLSSPDVNIAEKYLNAIPAQLGDVLFNPTGTVHAIGKGVVLAEIQQSSGITYRVWDWNRIPQRQLHIPQAMQSLHFRKTTKADFQLIPKRLRENEERLIDSFHFSLDRITLASGEEFEVDTKGGFQVLVCLEGKVELIGANSQAQLSQWESLLVPGAMGSYKIVPAENAVLLKAFVLTPQQIDPVIFQTYDVRAIADHYLSDRVCYFLGKGYGTFLRRETGIELPTVAVGGGVRLSTERIRAQLIKGIISTGVNVYDVGVTSTPELYFSIPYLNADGGVNITASHNESEYNGLKQVMRSADGFITSINAEQMLRLKQLILEGDFLEGEGNCTKLEEGEVVRYHNELAKANCRLGRETWMYLIDKWRERGLKALLDVTAQVDFPDAPDETKWAGIRQALDLPSEWKQPDTAIKYPLEGIKVVIDFGNGSAWRTGVVYSDLGAEVVALNETPDGSFPAHIPDPIKAKYRIQLEEAAIAEAARSTKEVVGIGNDEDADRVIYVRSDGRVVEGDRTLAIQARAIIEEHAKAGLPGKPRFLGEVKFSRVAEEFVTASGGEYIMSPTGFAFIKDGAKDLTRALRAGKSELELFGRKIDLRQNKEPIALAAELSGHQMSGHEENWIFDDATVAATKLLTVIASGLKEGKTFIDLDEEVPRYPATPELNIRLTTNILTEKQGVVDVVVALFRQKGYAIDTTDGGLIKWVDKEGQWLGQALIRKSNTQPMIICRVEGKDEQFKQVIEDEFFGELVNISTAAVPKLNLESDDYIRGILPRVMK